ncbi:MAG: 50S ribosomal protein L23 [Paludibacteraceae bacterium]|nr:50S ribosomal protein L23 [Paludibacteraceae bacterium]
MGIIIKPIVTEKATSQTEKLGKYAFKVVKDADKEQIKAAIEKEYKVTVVGISTAVVKGKVKSRYTKAGIIVGSTSDYKKAVVTLKQGDTIDFYSNI